MAKVRFSKESKKPKEKRDKMELPPRAVNFLLQSANTSSVLIGLEPFFPRVARLMNVKKAKYWIYGVLIFLSVLFFCWSKIISQDEFWISFLMSLSVAFIQLACGFACVNLLLERVEKNDNRRMASSYLSWGFLHNYAVFCERLQNTIDLYSKLEEKIASNEFDKVTMIQELDNAYIEYHLLVIDMKCCLDGLDKLLSTAILIKDKELTDKILEAKTIQDEADKESVDCFKCTEHYKKTWSEADFNYSLQAAIRFKVFIDELLSELKEYSDAPNSSTETESKLS